MANEDPCRVRYGEAFWRAHHEAWKQSALNQREYCEAQGIPLKAFGNWRAKFNRSRRGSFHRHARVTGGHSAKWTSVRLLTRRCGPTPVCRRSHAATGSQRVSYSVGSRS
jgi:hypothetical protein